MSPRAPLPLDELLGQLRGLCYEPPSRASWLKLCGLLDRCDQPDLPVAVDYVGGFVEAWTLDLLGQPGMGWRCLAAPEAWLRLFDEHIPEVLGRLPCVRVLELEGKQARLLLALSELGARPGLAAGAQVYDQPLGGAAALAGLA
jgi:hypothetical protein